ncbi:MAG: FAD-dependent oxidoreductase [marine benthic group bacterium]|nr:FAD-dependent oxidoreductase [Candidatus Benthicola marisminoris]
MSTPLGTEDHPLRVAIVGAGPAGFFTADALLKAPDLVCSIDMFNRLPTPYGLVREGVAPDHPSIKKVTAKYDRVAAEPNVRFFGNVTVGRDLDRAALGRHYHHVVYAFGAQSDRRLDIPGEDLQGSHPATEFVAWYNGHPDFADWEFDLSHERVVVVGNGNVAVDVARILVTDPDVLATTDIADHALAALRESQVREVVMLGRRGPAQCKFTSVELKELGRLHGVGVRLNAMDLDLDDASAAEAKRSRVATRNLEILRELTRRPASDMDRGLVLRFLASPVEILGSDGRVTGVRVERNRLVQTESGYIRSEGTGEIEELPAGLVLRSVGYRGVPIPGVPFDDERHVIPNVRGRVTDGPGGRPRPGEYAAGWIKRGPTGIIGTNKPDAVETVEAMLEDAAAGENMEPSDPGPESIPELLESRGVRFVTFDDWRKLDEAERAAGEAQGRPRVKVVRIERMLDIMGR